MSISQALIGRIVRDALPQGSTFEVTTDTSWGQAAHFRLADGTRLTLISLSLPHRPHWSAYWTLPGRGPTRFSRLTSMDLTQLRAELITSRVERLLQSKASPAT